jgi:ribonuclease HI
LHDLKPSVNDFTRTQSNTGRKTRASAQNRPKETKSFDFFAKAVKGLAVRSKLCNLVATPIWFSEICCGIAKIPYKELRMDETLEIIEQDRIIPQYKITGAKKVQLYTDGSMYENPKVMGSGCLFIEQNENEQEIKTEFWSKPTQHNVSSTKAEKWAILHGLEQCSNEVILEITTDSLDTIKAIHKMARNPSAREIIKIDDFPIVEKIHHELSRFDKRPEIKWVKSHSDDQYNNAADSIAKAACAMDLPLLDVAQYKTGIDKERDFHIHIIGNDKTSERLDRYPRSFVKKE